ncbi:ubiquitin-associated protein 1 [Denticeps clupeoides]|uniref:Ubiquitin-associated protein 1 n=1 Tax=Denticeps clupeoides TaxID=299321 RepID=A0AAY4ADN9_9TELE|nr:ubiquitin-associated protein 1 [Denticeps clupeoides]
MAARKSGSDTYNTGPVSYLDDVPFKLNEKFRCPAKVGLPIGFCLPDCNAVLSELQYDFGLERRTVRWGEELAKARAAEAKASKAAAAASSVFAQSQQEPRTAPQKDLDGGLAIGIKVCPSEDQDPPPPALNPVLAGLRHNDILTPLPAPSVANAFAHQPAQSSPSHCFNLADFEREEDPFDKLELKTLNDKEELRSILQGQPHTEPPGPTPTPAPEPRDNSTPPQPKPTLFHKPNGLVELLDLDRTAGVSGVGSCNIRSLTFPKLSDASDSPTESAALPSFAHTPSRSLSNGNTPTTQRTSSPSINSMVRQGVPNNGPPKQVKVVSGPAPGSLPCGGALLSLSPAERQCVETLVGMGYSYEGVIKAMQRQGQNVEQVLDYLFLHNRLCERGFDASAVEECLEMYQCSEEKALEFLQLMSRFGEMGFERDAIKEVLLVHNNDQDKALEDLMSRAAAS